MKATLFLALLASVAVADISYQQFINDNNVLNYALTLENLEAEFYKQGLAAFTSNDNFTSAGYPPGTRDLINFIAQQESSHAAFISNALNARQYPAVSACTYNFASAYVNVNTFVRTIATVENLGTQAYDGAAGALTSPDLLQIAAGIATIEAKHTSSINLLFATVNSSFPTAFEVAKSQSDVFNTAKGYIVSCNPVTVNSPYAGSVTVNSADPTTYTWQSAASLRGTTDASANAFYYGTAPNASNILLNDFTILQYALFLENLEATFYTTFANAYTAANIQADPIIGKYYNSVSAGIVANSIQTIGIHEAIHVATLNSTFTQAAGGGAKANGAPFAGSAPCSNYNWTSLGLSVSVNPTFSQFLAAASALESTGVGAYVGAIRYLQASTTAQTAATIATVEARHAAYIASLAVGVNSSTNGSLIFPSAQPNDTPRDLPIPPPQVIQLITVNLTNLLPTTCIAGNGNPAPLAGFNIAGPDFFNDRKSPVLGSYSGPVPTSTTTGNGAGATTTTGNGTPAGGNPSTTAASTTSARSNDATLAAASVALAAVVAALL